MSVTPLQIVGYLFAAAVTISCIQYLRSGELKEDTGVFRNRTRRDWAEIVLGGIACIVALFAVALAVERIPGILHWSWLSLMASKGESGEKGNQILAGAQIPYVGIIFMLLLFVNLPRLARAEEEAFRDGTKDWKDALPRSLKFGLMHMVVGVPLWVGLVLFVPGMWFTQQYFKGGIDRSTMAHAIYNMMLAGVLMVALMAN